MSGFVSSFVSSWSFTAAASVRLRTVGWGSIMRCVLLRTGTRREVWISAAHIVRSATDSDKHAVRTGPLRLWGVLRAPDQDGMNRSVARIALMADRSASRPVLIGETNRRMYP